MRWVVADLHFNHFGILDLERPQFNTIEEHNNYIIERFNQMVSPSDLVYFLGDVGFYSPTVLKSLISRMNGKKILIYGNHDQFSAQEAYEMGFSSVYDHPIYLNNCIILSHEPVQEGLNNPYVYNIHGHLHNADLNLPNYFNANIARNNYYPVNLDNLVKKVYKKCKNRRETFKNEWYFNFYKFD